MSRTHFPACSASTICPRSMPRWKGELATPNAGLVTDIIACPGLDYCALANARSIPIAQRSRSASPSPSARRRSANLRSRFPAASMPAAITMSATSAFSASREGQGVHQSAWAAGSTRSDAVGDIIGYGFSSVQDYPRGRKAGHIYLRAQRECGTNFHRRLSPTWTSSVEAGALRRICGLALRRPSRTTNTAAAASRAERYIRSAAMRPWRSASAD